MAGPLVEAATAVGDAAYAGYKALPWVTQQLLNRGVQSVFAAQGLNNFFGPEGTKKTTRLLNEGKYGDAILSAAGDLLDISMAAPALEATQAVVKAVRPFTNKTVSFLNSPLTGNWTKMGNKEYRLSSNSLGSGAIPIEQRSLQDFTPGELDVAYSTAISKGDRKTALKLLDEAYKRSGIPITNITVDALGNPIVWYHGSRYGNHTIFDSSKMNATIGGESAAGKVKGNFLTTDLPSAARYANGKYTNGQGVIGEFTEPTTFLERLQNLFGKYKPQRIHPSNRIPTDLRLNPDRLFTTKDGPVVSYIGETNNVVYPMYVNPGEKVYTVDFKGNPWSKSPVQFPNAFSVQKTIRDDINRTYRDEVVPFINRDAAVGYYHSLQDRFGKAWVENPSELNDKYFPYSGGDRSVEMHSSAPTYEKARLIETHVPNTTNGAVQTAAREGYSSVHIPNVIDSNVATGDTPYAIDDLVTLISNQMKLADVTYDAEGNLIPLSKRFDWSNPDTRYRSNTPEIKMGGGLFGKLKGILNSKRVNTSDLKSTLKAEFDTDNYLQRLQATGYSEEQQRLIIADAKRAIDNTEIIFKPDLTPKESYYSGGTAYIGTMGGSKEEIIESILHEVGHSDIMENSEGLHLLRNYNNKNTPAFRKEYLFDSPAPTEGRKPRWEYYGDDSEAARRAKAVKRWADKYYPNKPLEDVYDIIQAKINNGEKLPQDVYDYVYSYNEPKSAKEFLNRAIGISPIIIGAGTAGAISANDRSNSRYVGRAKK